MAREKKSNNYSTRKGGTRRSTNEQFQNEVQQRIWGNRAGIKGMAPDNPNLPRVAAAGAGNLPDGIRREANRQGGRNALPVADMRDYTSRTGRVHLMTPQEYRQRELASAFGVPTNAVKNSRGNSVG